MTGLTAQDRTEAIQSGEADDLVVRRTFPSTFGTEWTVQDYDLAGTLTSGQAFRWTQQDDGWCGVVDSKWVRLRTQRDLIRAEVVEPSADWRWLSDYLQVEQDFAGVIAAFPDDEPMRVALKACRGLRLLRQDPWECLASFICSSTKQIVQIRQMVACLCEQFGRPVQVPSREKAAFSFPTPERIAGVSIRKLLECKLGFRAPYLQATARAVAGGEINLSSLRTLTVDKARARLMELPGVGPKIANCVLLFAYGFQEAFPVDVWVEKALRRLYFSNRPVSSRQLQEFTSVHFGPWSGYAQQYLFHYIRVHARRPP
jgi:N-glycosylase/DNA lyase